MSSVRDAAYYAFEQHYKRLGWIVDHEEVLTGDDCARELLEHLQECFPDLEDIADDHCVFQFSIAPDCVGTKGELWDAMQSLLNAINKHPIYRIEWEVYLERAE